MAYCVLADVQKLIKWAEFNSNSKVTATEVTNEFIPEADTIINSKLSRVYVTPITNTDDLKIIKYIACRMVACEIAHVLILQASGDISDIVLRWCEQAKDRLNSILTQDVLLTGSTLLDDVGGGRLYSFTAFGNSENEAPDAKWRMNINQW
jgi:hypothetical protein